MATSQKIEENVIADVKALLDDAGIANVESENVRQPEEQSFVLVACVNLRDELDSGTIPSGMRRATMAIECWSFEADDKDGAILNALVAECRTVMYASAILSNLNTASTYHTYYGLLAGDDLPDTEDRYRIISIQFDLILKPEK